MRTEAEIIEKIERTQRIGFHLHLLDLHYSGRYVLPPRALQLVRARVDEYELAKTPEQREQERREAEISWLDADLIEQEEEERTSCPDCGAPENEIPRCPDCNN